MVRIDIVLLMAGRKPLEVELGDESLVRERPFVEGSKMSIPIDKVKKDCVPLAISSEPFEGVFRACSLP